MTYDALCRMLADHGLRGLGGFAPMNADGLPVRSDGRPVRQVVVIGNVGPVLHERFSAAPEHRDGRSHPLDRWIQRIVGEVAAAFAADALYPFDGPPWWPFQRWAMRADPR